MHIRGRSRPIVQFWSVLFGAILLVVGSNLLSTPSAYASVPNGFADSVVANISAPTDIAFTPDGTMLVTSQNGGLYKRSGSSTTKVLDLSGKICSDFERGLLGVTVDPLYASNNYIYLFYTYNRHNTCIDNSPSSPNNRVSRFTFNGSSVTGETVLVDNIYSLNGNHNGGGMTFGKDGYLYISIGDSGCQLGVPSNCAGGNGNSRKKNILNGKVLRVSRDGIAPSSNPFYSAGGTCRVSGSTPADTHCKETYAWGFRNPFRIAANPNSSSTQIYVNDVGQDEWEEIDALQAGKDYGWNYCEGFTNASGGGNCGFSDTNPLYVYGHGSCNSITGGAFIPNGSWPTAYNNLYFFADYTCGTIWTLKNSGGTWSRTVFASGLGAVTELEFGPDGANVALYYTNYGSSQVRKITYTSSSNRRPTADVDASPTYGTLPLEVSFDGRDSVDPDSDSLTFAWDFGDGTSSTSSHPTKTFTQQLDYTVRLTVSDGRGGTDTDSVIIRAGNTRPTAEITAPSATSEFYVGQTIKLRGVGTDAEDSPGKIPASRMTWEVRLHHDTHFHPFFGPTTGNYLTFQAPAPEDLLAATNSYLEIRLTVRDATGLGKLVTMNLYPNKVNVTVGSNVPGMLIWIEGQPYAAPATVLTWENNPLTI
ncbi:MAG TPA: PQQ-dependent sugar dehydrogenase, partial [Thermomicrobiales bacterium]|nr:PQQ-dependent sugar dehydrogenase [Thermomicrobiales bacterium]